MHQSACDCVCVSVSVCCILYLQLFSEVSNGTLVNYKQIAYRNVQLFRS